MGIKITTDNKGVKVWRSDKFGKPRYSISFNTKEGDTWVRDYQEVQFKKGVEVANGETIHITNAFPAVRSWVKDDKQHIKTVWMILEFTSAGGSVQQPTSIPEADNFTLSEDDIPF